MEDTERMNIAVTKQARTQLLKLGLKDAGVLRLSVRPGGCAGMQYEAELADEVSEAEKLVFDEEGIRIAASQNHEMYLDGLKIDFSDDLIRPGFILSNPNAQGSCGCGSSFGDKKKGGCCG
jgi:iron-sulfur cluster assembly protein